MTVQYEYRIASVDPRTDSPVELISALNQAGADGWYVAGVQPLSEIILLEREARVAGELEPLLNPTQAAAMRVRVYLNAWQAHPDPDFGVPDFVSAIDGTKLSLQDILLLLTTVESFL